MSVRLTIIEQMEQIAREHGKILAPLKEDLVLADCGLDFARLCRPGRAPRRQAGHRSVHGRRGRRLSGDARRFRESLRAWQALTRRRCARQSRTPKAPRFFWDRAASIRFTDLDRGTSFGGRLAELAGRSVLLATASQLTSALALIELDGLARRIVILPPDAAAEHLGAAIAIAGVDAVVIDDGTPPHDALALAIRVTCAPAIVPMRASPLPRVHTEWVLMTSGTTGVPKMVVHDLESLTAAMRASSPADGASCLGHVLRHSPLRRPADLPARRVRRRLTGSLQRRRAGRRSSGASWRSTASRISRARRRNGVAP